MMKSPLGRTVHHVITIIAALGALHVGLLAMGYNMLGLPFLAQFTRPIEYIFGLAGAITLVMCVLCLLNVCDPYSDSCK